MLGSFFFFFYKSRTPVSIRQQLATIIIMVTPPIIIPIDFFFFAGVAIGHQLFDYLPTRPENISVFFYSNQIQHRKTD
jgi:hypothetical protein